MAIIPLSRGYSAQVDDADLDWLSQWKWSVQVCKGTCYARRTVTSDDGGRRVNLYMHRALVRAPEGVDVDHIDHEGLNNQRANLQEVTHARNLWNCAPSPERDGVYWHHQSSRWRARLRLRGRLLHVGGFLTEADALAAHAFVHGVLRGGPCKKFPLLRLPPTVRRLVIAKLALP